MGQFVDSQAFSPTPVQDEAIKALDSYRKELTHSGDSTLVVTVGWFPTMILEALSVIDWLLEESNTITMFAEEKERARETVKLVRETASRLGERFAPAQEPPTPQP